MSRSHADYLGFIELVDRYADASITDADLAELQRRMRDDHRARAWFRSYHELATAIAARTKIAHGHTIDAAPAPHDHAPVANRSRGRAPFRIPRSLMFTLAATLLLTACGVAIVAIALNNQKSQINNQQSPLSVPIATLTWADEPIEADEPIMTGQSFGAQTIRTRAGESEFQLTSGAAIQLRGRSQLTMHSPLSATLTRGSAAFDCPPTAKGYTVHLPDGSRVVDLGTRFRITVTPDAVQTVVVSEGTVELHRLGITAAVTLDPHHAARYAAGEWTVVGHLALGVTGHSDSVRYLTAPPLTVANGEYEDSERVMLFRERAGVSITKPHPVTAVRPGRYTLEARGRTAPTGVTVDSYLLHFDPVDLDDPDEASDGPSPYVQIEASVTFDRPIVAVIAAADALIETDGVYGAPGTTYGTFQRRGLDFAGRSAESNDQFTLSDDRRTLTVSLVAYANDQVRVLVDAEPDHSEPHPLTPVREPAHLKGDSQ